MALVLKTSERQRSVGSNPTLSAILYRTLAQLVERLLYTQNVGGSNPSRPTKFFKGKRRSWRGAADCKSVRKVSRFESYLPHQIGPVAQSGERRPVTAKVARSKLVGSAI